VLTAVLKNNQDTAVTALKAVQNDVLTALKAVQDAEKKLPSQKLSIKTYSHQFILILFLGETPLASGDHHAHFSSKVLVSLPSSSTAAEERDYLHRTPYRLLLMEGKLNAILPLQNA
jgi:hypothetical protein